MKYSQRPARTIDAPSRKPSNTVAVQHVGRAASVHPNLLSPIPKRRAIPPAHHNPPKPLLRHPQPKNSRIQTLKPHDPRPKDQKAQIRLPDPALIREHPLISTQASPSSPECGGLHRLPLRAPTHLDQTTPGSAEALQLGSEYMSLG
jgi:hypothetical protein